MTAPTFETARDAAAERVAAGNPGAPRGRTRICHAHPDFVLLLVTPTAALEDLGYPNFFVVTDPFITLMHEILDDDDDRDARLSRGVFLRAAVWYTPQFWLLIEVEAATPDVHGREDATLGDSHFRSYDLPGVVDPRGIGENSLRTWFSDANGKSHGFLRTAAGSCTTLDVPGAIHTRVHEAPR